MAVNNKSEIFNNASVFVEGMGFISSSAKGKLPELEFMEFTTTSGMAEHTTPSTVLKQMKATLELIEENKVYMQALAKRRGEMPVFWIKYETNNGKQVVVTLKGHISKMSTADVETGKENKKMLEVNVSFYKKEVDGVVDNLIDVDNLICEIGGVDVWADARSFHIG